MLENNEIDGIYEVKSNNYWSRIFSPKEMQEIKTNQTLEHIHLMETAFHS